MIKNSTIQASIPAIQRLRDKGISLETIEGSPLDQLADTTKSPFPETENETISVESMVEEVRDLSLNPTLVDGSAHDMVMDEVVPGIVQRLSRSKQVAREVLTPATKRVDALVKDALQNFTPIRFWIDEYRPHPIYQADELITSVDRFENAPWLPGELKLPVIAPLDEPALIEMLQTGMQSFDTLVADWLGRKPEGWLSAAFNSFFGTGLDTDLIPPAQQGFYYKGLERVPTFEIRMGSEDQILAGYLLASVLIDKPQGGTGISLSEWKSQLGKLMELCGSALITFRRILANYQATKTIILQLPAVSPIWKTKAEDARVVVFGPAYSQFLEAGGTPEIVIGSVVGRMNLTTTDQLLAEKDNCLSNYGAYENMLAMEVEQHSTEAIRNAFLVGMATVVNEIPEQELKGPKETIHEAIRQATENTDWANIDIYNCAREVLASVVFKCPLALDIVKRIDVLMDSSDYTPQEAAYIAYRDVTANYVANQIRTVRGVE